MWHEMNEWIPNINETEWIKEIKERKITFFYGYFWSLKNDQNHTQNECEWNNHMKYEIISLNYDHFYKSFATFYTFKCIPRVYSIHIVHTQTDSHTDHGRWIINEVKNKNSMRQNVCFFFLLNSTNLMLAHLRIHKKKKKKNSV